jgi:hypothetical protein
MPKIWPKHEKKANYLLKYVRFAGVPLTGEKNGRKIGMK